MVQIHIDGTREREVLDWQIDDNGEQRVSTSTCIFSGYRDIHTNMPYSIYTNDGTTQIFGGHVHNVSHDRKKTKVIAKSHFYEIVKGSVYNRVFTDVNTIQMMLDLARDFTSLDVPADPDDAGVVFEMAGTPGTPGTPAIPATGPWAYLRFENNLNDSSGNNRTPQNSGITFVAIDNSAGFYGNAALLNSSDYIRWNDAPSPRDPFTLAFTVLDISTGNNIIMNYGNFTVSATPAGGINETYTVSFGGTTETYTTSSAVFFAFVWDGTDFRWYVNGTLEYTWSNVTSSDITVSNTLEFVCSGTDSWYIDQLQLYETALTAANVTTISSSETSVTTDAVDAVPAVPGTPGTPGAIDLTHSYVADRKLMECLDDLAKMSRVIYGVKPNKTFFVEHIPETKEPIHIPIEAEVHNTIDDSAYQSTEVVLQPADGAAAQGNLTQVIVQKHNPDGDAYTSSSTTFVANNLANYINNNATGPHTLAHSPTGTLTVTIHVWGYHNGSLGSSEITLDSSTDYTVVNRDVTLTTAGKSATSTHIRSQLLAYGNVSNSSTFRAEVRITYEYVGNQKSLRGRIENAPGPKRTVRIPVPQLVDTDTARSMMQGILDEYGTPDTSAKITIPYPSTLYNVGDIVVQNLDGDSRRYQITQIHIERTKTVLTIGLERTYYEHDAEIWRAMHNLEQAETENVDIPVTDHIIQDRYYMKSWAQYDFGDFVRQPTRTDRYEMHERAEFVIVPNVSDKEAYDRYEMGSSAEYVLFELLVAPPGETSTTSEGTISLSTASANNIAILPPSETSSTSDGMSTITLTDTNVNVNPSGEMSTTSEGIPAISTTSISPVSVNPPSETSTTSEGTLTISVTSTPPVSINPPSETSSTSEGTPTIATTITSASISPQGETSTTSEGTPTIATETDTIDVPLNAMRGIMARFHRNVAFVARVPGIGSSSTTWMLYPGEPDNLLTHNEITEVQHQISGQTGRPLCDEWTSIPLETNRSGARQHRYGITTTTETCHAPVFEAPSGSDSGTGTFTSRYMAYRHGTVTRSEIDTWLQTPNIPVNNPSETSTTSEGTPTITLTSTDIPIDISGETSTTSEGIPTIETESRSLSDYREGVNISETYTISET